MSLNDRIDRAIATAIGHASVSGAPRRLASAMEYAVTPGGARIRPTILLSVAIACGDANPRLADAAAAALELMHCASLVHDDLPAFDDAHMRRGKPSVHRAYGDGLAVLTGDSLILLSMQTLARNGTARPDLTLRLIGALGLRTGMPDGICAGQGWESEPVMDLSAYHLSKTGALFIAATEMGAIASGQEPEPWIELGARIGEAFQVADDLRDALMGESELGKPVGQDNLHGRPNAVTELGAEGAAQRLRNILAGAIASIPSCPGEAALAHMVRLTADRIIPEPVRQFGLGTVPGE